MQRRTFIRLSGGAAVAVIAFPEAGCGFSVTGTLSVIIDAVQGILNYVGPTQPWAAELSAALSALKQAMQSWQNGGASVLVIDALNTLEAITAVIPFTAVYSPLIDLIVSGIEAIINYFAPEPAVAFTRPRVTRANNPRVGRVALRAPGWLHPTYQGAFKAQWNDMVIGIGLPQLKLN